LPNTGYGRLSGLRATYPAQSLEKSTGRDKASRRRLFACGYAF